MPLKLAIVATGNIADTQLAPAITAADSAVLWSVYSREQSKADKFAQKHAAQSSTPGFASFDALLADEQLDAVLLASPDGLHAEQAIAAARAGKHVLTEKPMTTSNEAAQEMIDACAQNNVKLGVAYHLRWHNAHRALHKAAGEGYFGTLRHMRVQWPMAADPNNWRAHSEVGRWWCLAGVGTHCLDQVRWFMCPEHGEVAKLEKIITRSVYKGPHEETAILALEFESGATAEICNSVLFNGPKRMEIYGADGFALCEETLGALGAGSVTTHEGPFEFSPCNPFVGEIEDFARAVKDDVPPEVDGTEGARNVALLIDAVS